MIDTSKLSPQQLKVYEKVRSEAERQGVDPELAVAVAQKESNFTHSAKSPVGAQGVMQLMPITAKHYKVDASNMDQNIRAGVNALKDHLNTFGNPVHALMAYNWGGGNVKKYLAGDVKPENVPMETQNYLKRIHAVTAIKGDKNFIPEQDAGQGANGGGDAIPPRPDANASSGERATWDLMYGAKPKGAPIERKDYASEIFGGGAGGVSGATVGTIAGGKFPIQIGGFPRKPPSLSSIESEHQEVGRPLTKIEMMHPAGQGVEKARVALDNKIIEWRKEQALHAAEQARIEAEHNRLLGLRPTVEAEAARNARPYVQLGGVQSPEIKVTSSINRQIPAPVTTPQAVAPDPNFSPFMGRFNQETGTYARENETGFNAGTKNVHQTMRAGDRTAPSAVVFHNPISQETLNRYSNPLGHVLVDPITQSLGIQARFPQAPSQQQQDTTTAQREAAQIRRNMLYQQAEQAHRLSQSDLTANRSDLRAKENELFSHGLSEPERMIPRQYATAAPTRDLAAARRQLPSQPALYANAAGKMAPTIGGALFGTGAGLFGAHAYDTAETDPLASNISKAGMFSGMLGTIPHYSTRGIGLTGMLGSLGLLKALENKNQEPEYGAPAGSSRAFSVNRRD